MTAQENPDTTLVIKAAKGDPMAFAELFDIHFQSVYNYAFSLSQDKSQADDLTQEAFIRAHNNLNKLGPPWNFRAWVFRLTRNLFVDLTRRSRSNETMKQRLPSPESGPDPEKETLLNEIAERVHNVLQQLSPQHREIINLRELHSFSYAEISSIMEISPSNVGVMLQRARTKFQQAYGIRVILEEPTENCTDVTGLLSVVHDAESLHEQRQFVEEHLQECEACQERKRSLVTMSYIMGLLVPMMPPMGLQKRILKETGTTGQLQRLHRNRQLKTYLIGGGIGGLLGIMLLAFLFNFGGGGGTTPQEPPSLGVDSATPFPSSTGTNTSTANPPTAALEMVISPSPTVTITLEPSPTITPSPVPPTATFTPTPIPPTATFTPVPSGTIGGIVFRDSDSSGSRQGGEAGISGVTVHLGQGACASSGYQSKGSSSDGGFNFTNLPAGTYCLSVNIPLACNTYSAPTTPTQYTINLGPGGSVSKLFGYANVVC